MSACIDSGICVHTIHIMKGMLYNQTQDVIEQNNLCTKSMITDNLVPLQQFRNENSYEDKNSEFSF